jgi:sialic acid synthase SpsE
MSIGGEGNLSGATDVHGGPIITIGGHEVGGGGRALIVAEAGVNHDGSVDQAVELVDVACEAGADAVKFQVFDAAELVLADAPMASYQSASCEAADQRAMLRALQLSQADFARIAQRCQTRGILFLATPFGTEAVGSLMALGVPAIKLASTDLNNQPLTTAVIESGVPLILSTGASTAEEIERAVRFVRSSGAGDRLILLHCVSCYPLPDEAANLRAMGSLAATYQVPVGLSDHTRSTRMGGWAVAAGACVIEKHFTLDRSMSGPDHLMSLSPPQLADYVQEIRAAESAMGSGVIGLTALEEEVRVVARRSVVSSRDIPCGVEITADMLAVKRPGTGIAPTEMDRLVGCRSSVDIDSDTQISWDMLQ